MSFLFGDDKSKIKYTGDAAADLASLKNAVGSLKVLSKTAAGGTNNTYNSATFYLDPLTRAMIVCNSANGQANGIINVYVDSSGWVSTFPIVGASNQQTSHAITTQLKIENRTSSVCMYTMFVLSGDAS